MSSFTITLLIFQSRRQPHCAQCYRSIPQLPSGTALNPCPKCDLVFSCSACKDSLPPHECETYQRVGSLENFRIAHFENSGQVYGHAPTDKPRKHYRALNTARNWYEYYADISDKKDAVQHVVTPNFDLNVDLLAQADAETQKSIQRMWLYLILSTETQTMPLTILSALEDTISDLSTKTNLRLHLVGAGAKEIKNLLVFEELLHLLPNLKELKLIFVGPECKSTGATIDDPMPEMAAPCCPDCTRRGRKRIMALCSEPYHEYAKMSQYQTPDIAILFHSGRSQDQIESWKPTTKYLVESSIPTICTTYTEREALEEAAELQRLNARFLKKPEVNTWKSLCPRIEPMEGKDHTFYYDNFYRYIFQGKN
jgi:splicing suppressor protein 51